MFTYAFKCGMLEKKMDVGENGSRNEFLDIAASCRDLQAALFL